MNKYGKLAMNHWAKTDPGRFARSGIRRRLRAGDGNVPFADVRLYDRATTRTGLWDGHLTAYPDGRFTCVLDGHTRRWTCPLSPRVELRALLSLRNSAKALLTAEAANVDDTSATDELRADLHAGYTAYTARYGPINRFSVRSVDRAHGP